LTVRIINADCRSALAEVPSESVHCCVTSPPYYGLRDYGCDGQIGLEETPDAYVAEMVAAFREVRRILRPDGTLWLNIGDSYAGSGKGGNPEEGKQATNRGSQSVGVLYGKVGDTARQAAVTNVTRRTFRPGGDPHGGLEERGYRNRDGLGRFAEIKAKDLIGIPWMLAFALRGDGWWLRQDIIWAKPNPMPESVTDRCTRSHEHIFMLSKSAKYFYDAEAIAEPARGWSGQAATFDRTGPVSDHVIPGQTAAQHRKRDKQHGHSRRHAGFNDRWDQMERAEQCSGLRNKRDIWEIATQPYAEAHFATFPPKLIEPCVLAGCPKDGAVLDPFAGAGTTGLVADRLGRHATLIELNPEYAALMRRRIEADAGMFASVAD
jgi:DNA modification methylase